MYIKNISEQYYTAFVGTRILRGFALASLIMPLYFLIGKNVFLASTDTSVAGFDITTIALIVNFIAFLLLFTAYVRIVSGGYLISKIIKALGVIYIIILLLGIGSTILNMDGLQELGDSGLSSVLNNMFAASLIQSLFVFACVITVITGMAAHLSFQDTEYDIIYRNKEISSIRYGISHFFNQPYIASFGLIMFIQLALILVSVFFEGIAYFIIIQSAEIVRGLHYWVKYLSEFSFVPFLFVCLILLFIVFQVLLLIAQSINAVSRRITLDNVNKAQSNASLSQQSVVVLQKTSNEPIVLDGVKKSLFAKLFDRSSSFKTFGDVIYHALSFMGPIVTPILPEPSTTTPPTPNLAKDIIVDKQWQKNTIEMMLQSRMIVLLASQTSIIIWAIKEILASDKLLAKTLFIFPPGCNDANNEFLNNLPDSIRNEVNENVKQGSDIIGFRVINSKAVILTTSQPQIDMEYYFSLRFLASQSFP